MRRFAQNIAPETSAFSSLGPVTQCFEADGWMVSHPSIVWFCPDGRTFANAKATGATAT
jgi:hypothetical protein